MSVTFIPFAFPGIPGVRAVFTTAATGPDRGNISRNVPHDPDAVRANRTGLMERLGFAHWCSLKQVHGTDMAFDPDPVGPGDGSVIVADGSATDSPGKALVIKTADCQPILLAHKDGRHVAALHVGWRGNVLEFPQKGVRAFCERYGLDPAELSAVRGPSLGPAMSEFKNFEMEFGERFRDFFDPATNTVNLWRLTVAQLLEAGLKRERIYGLDLCTHSLAEFHSYRRDKAASGRQASLVWIG
ncbi:Laccase domain protein YfiH [Fundidesulfovibrio magnetotacticus]|uniref:Laccase domain protein YfiH n=1 Tax=Fundidesulfovibrio magnetotacticus TaxID=2730080 RepID=A0A6V8LTD6_9BACT|nr:polyphenol oxidase family protein [Fundidesulfovibrio magnetotacticus]GFK93349.1 Laccase domain protein YfiH [Fundidesulfovibrio magnetotacticus]